MISEMKNNSPILAIDSSTSTLRIGLIRDDGRIVRHESTDKFRHAEHILDLIDQALKEGGILPSELTGIVVATGPGSFTGLRVGMAAAKGLAEALKIPVAGLSVYRAVAAKIFGQFGPVTLLIPSRRDEFYYGCIDSASFDDGAIQIIHTENLLQAAGSRRLLFLDFNPDEFNFPQDALIDAEKALISIDDFLLKAKDLLKDGGDDLSLLEPIYIQKFPARIPQ
ncbi:hypothetical protein TRIP_C20904 [Candidatus Zixiibacteriota bacterium]|nr:hypothetical protein TRIP_C20904 [candidate division Zixibacteria bacterium]